MKHQMQGRRRLLGAGLAGLAALAVPKRGRAVAPDLSGVRLRVATFKGFLLTHQPQPVSRVDMALAGYGVRPIRGAGSCLRGHSVD